MEQKQNKIIKTQTTPNSQYTHRGPATTMARFYTAPQHRTDQ